jgi:tRNA-dihydrouridine synthase
MKSNLDNLPKPFLILAPMDDVTDTVFRRVIDGCAPPDLYFTEFVNVDGLQSPGRSKIFKKLLATEQEHPLVIQLWGKNPENYRKTAEQIADGSLQKELGNSVNFAGVDINMGCPDKTIVKHGSCGGLIKDRTLAGEIIEATREGLNGKLPLSVKTRIGFSGVDLGWIEYILQFKLNMLSVHLRTVKEMSAVPAHWELMTQIRQIRDKISPSTSLIGNGDVMTRNEAMKLAKEHGIDGVMIGRGIFHDPFAFAEKSPWETYSKQQKIELYLKHVKLFAATWKNEERRIHTLNKFCKIYINNFDGAKELREELMHCSNMPELKQRLENAHEVKFSQAA